MAPPPDPIVAHRGPPLGPGPRLVAVQLFARPADYASAERFEGLVRTQLEQAAALGLLHERTIVVLPEPSGAWLVVLEEGPGVYEAATLSDALTNLAVAHLPVFLWHASTSPAADGGAFAAFTVTAERMAAV